MNRLLWIVCCFALLAGCSQTKTSQRVFFNSFPEPGAELFVHDGQDWKPVGKTPSFIYLAKKSHQGIVVQARYNGMSQERIVQDEQTVDFSFAEEQPATSLPTGRLAITDIRCENLSDLAIGRALTDYLAGQLRSSKRYTLIERPQIKDVAQDVAFVSPQKLKQLFVDVDVLLVGRVSYAASKYIISFRLVSTDNAQVLAQGSDECEKQEEIFARAGLLLHKMNLLP